MIFILPWWLTAALGVVLLLISGHLKNMHAGLLPVGPIFAPFIKIAAFAFFFVAILSLLGTLFKSLLRFSRGNRSYHSPKAAYTSLIVEILRTLFNAGMREWANSEKHAAYRNNYTTASPHAEGPMPTNQPGKTAEIIGESGAWLDIAQELQLQGLNVKKIGDIEPLLGRLRETCQPAINSFHKVISKCILLKNDQIAALRAEKGFFAAIINWFLIRGKKVQIAKLLVEEDRYSKILTGNIHRLESLLNSPELAGAKAELEVIEKLRGLPAEYTVFNNLQLQATRFIKFNGVPLQSAQIDHAVLSTAGVFLIETKRWSKHFVESGSYHNPFDQAQRARYLCYDLLKMAFGKTPVRGIILTSDSLPDAPADSFTKVLHLKDLNGYLTWFNRAELTPVQMGDIRQYLERRVVGPIPSARDITLETPAQTLNSAFLNEILSELSQAEKGAPSGTPRKSRAVLIPTEPPESKIDNDLRFMPPAMRKTIEDEAKAQREKRLDNSHSEPPLKPLPPDTPKDLKYMPPSMRADFEDK